MRLLRALSVGVVVVAVAVATLEVTLQVASRFAPERAGAWRDGARTRILCAGDSHTWGAGVERAESYPAQLERVLDEEAPGEYSVMNVGVPGMNTSQLRRRIPQHLGRHAPDVLIVWAGINNEWNAAEVDEATPRWLDLADRFMLRSRVYRFLRVWSHDRALERYPVESAEGLAWQPATDSQEGPIEDRADWTIRHDGVVEKLQHRREAIDVSRVERIATEDFRAIATLARAAGTRLVFVGYPLNVGGFERANAAMWTVSRELDLQFVHGWKSLGRVPPREREWLWAMHPGVAIYREIVRDLRRAVLDPRSQRRGDAVPTSEFRRSHREQWRLVLRAALEVARADPPIVDAERELLDSLREFYASERDLDALPRLRPDELAGRLEPDLRGSALSLLSDVAQADGGTSEPERSWIEAGAASIGR